MSERFRVVRLDEIDGYADEGKPGWHMIRFWTTQDWESAIGVLTAQLAEDPGNANMLYNLACAESRDGRLEPAREHLARAVELEPQFADNALNDPDLDAIRGDDRFPRPARQ